MESIAVSELRSNLMKIIKKIESGASIDITSRGKVVARLVPPDSVRQIAKDKLRALGQTAVLRDIISPIDAKWDAGSS